MLGRRQTHFAGSWLSGNSLLHGLDVFSVAPASVRKTSVFIQTVFSFGGPPVAIVVFVCQLWCGNKKIGEEV